VSVPHSELRQQELSQTEKAMEKVKLQATATATRIVA
jgi:hypothetical protein